MTYTDVKYCDDLINKIDKYSQDVKNFDKFLKRVYQITTMFTKEIEIKINEGYINTPFISVSLDNFINFIQEEKNNKKELRDKTEEELFAFYPNKEEK